MVESIGQEAIAISQLSRLRALNGQSNFSAETLEAIKNGAIPPTVIEPKEKVDPISEATDEVRQAVEQTAKIQQGEVGTVDEEVIVALSKAAQVIVDDSRPVVDTLPANDAGIPLNNSTEEAGNDTDISSEQEAVVTSQNIAQETNRDTATTALGNTVDIKA